MGHLWGSLRVSSRDSSNTTRLWGLLIFKGNLSHPYSRCLTKGHLITRWKAQVFRMPKTKITSRNESAAEVQLALTSLVRTRACALENSRPRSTSSPARKWQTSESTRELKRRSRQSCRTAPRATYSPASTTTQRVSAVATGKCLPTATIWTKRTQSWF